VGDNRFDLVAIDACHRRHVPERPMVSPDPSFDGHMESDVGVVVRLVIDVDEWRSLGGPEGTIAMAGGAIGVERRLTTRHGRGYGRGAHRCLDVHPLRRTIAC